MTLAHTVLGMCLKSREHLDLIISMGVSPAHFSDTNDRKIFAVILEEEKAGREVDIVSVSLRLPELSLAIIAMAEEAPVAQNAGFFVRSLLNVHWKRQVATRLGDFVKTVLHHGELDPVDSLQEQLIETVDSLSRGPHEIKIGRDMPEILKAVVGSVEDAIKARKEGKPLAITTGLPTLDRTLVGGWHNKRITTIAARSGKGKTTVGLCFTRNALLAGYKVAFFSVEADAEELGERIVANEASVNSALLGNGSISEAEADRFMSAVQRLSSTHLVVDDAFDADINIFEQRLRSLKRRGKVDLAFLDYIQQCSDTSVKSAGKAQEIARMTGRVKRLAMSLDIPIVMLAQLNRNVDREDDFPIIADLADSSSIEKDSDHVLFIHWIEDRPNVSTPYMRVMKNRKNASGQTIKLSAELGFGRFEEARQ
jgi:replicative DNA helicase